MKHVKPPMDRKKGWKELNKAIRCRSENHMRVVTMSEDDLEVRKLDLMDTLNYRVRFYGFVISVMLLINLFL